MRWLVFNSSHPLSQWELWVSDHHGAGQLGLGAVRIASELMSFGASRPRRGSSWPPIACRINHLIAWPAARPTGDLAIDEFAFVSLR